MKKTKVIIPALGLLVLSTAASVSGTVAWFSVNSSVSATGMKVQAKAEAGLLISADQTEASWANTDETLYTTAVSLVPTSTADFETWYHATSTSASSYAAVGGYSQLSTTQTGTGYIQVVQTNLATSPAVAEITYANDATAGYIAADDTGYYLRTRFYLKSSGDALAVSHPNSAGNWLMLDDITVSGLDAQANSLDIDATLRVGVQIDESSVKILAPFSAATGSYTVGGSTQVVASKGTLAGAGSYNPNLDTGWTGTIPAKNSAAADLLPVDIYLWFEGEDEKCISNNIASTLDTLTVSVGFALVESAPTGTAVAKN